MILKNLFALSESYPDLKEEFKKKNGIELITIKEYPAPKVSLNPEVTNFYDFTTNDLIVEDYRAGNQVKFEVAI